MQREPLIADGRGGGGGGLLRLLCGRSSFAQVELEKVRVVSGVSAPHGGDSTAVRERMPFVTPCGSTQAALAVVLDDCSVAFWGSARLLSRCSLYRPRGNVTEFFSTELAGEVHVGSASRQLGGVQKGCRCSSSTQVAVAAVCLMEVWRPGARKVAGEVSLSRPRGGHAECCSQWRSRGLLLEVSAAARTSSPSAAETSGRAS